jgi:uncharacterized protein involved in exopolysaccharide biosynthesis
MMADFSPAAATRRILDAWVWVAGFILIGGLLGWLFHSLRAPVYEARTTLRMGIDYTRTGWPNEIEEDRAIEVAGFLLTSRPVLEKVAAAANAEGLQISPDDFLRSLALERRSYTWLLRVRHAQPETAAHLADLWLQTGLQTLEEASGHAFQAEQLRRHLSGLEACLAQAGNSEPAGGICSIQTLADLQTEMAEVGAAYQQEKSASLGVSSMVLFGEGEPATVPQAPALYGRAELMAAGMFLGLLLGIVLTSSGLLKKIRRSGAATTAQSG